MSWRQILESNPKDNRDRRDKSPSEDPFCHFSLFSPVETGLKNEGIWNEFQFPHFEHLTDQGKEVFREYIGEMLFPKYGAKLTLEKAQSLAMELVSCVPGNLRENIKE